MLTKYRFVLTAVPVALLLASASIAHATDVVIHGKVLTAPKSGVFRMLVQETNKERSIFVGEKTVYKFSNGKSAVVGDVKVGKTVEVKGQVKSADAYTASAVSIRI